MAQNKNRGLQPGVELEVLSPAVDASPAEGELPHIRFAFGVWVLVFSLLALSIIWDSIYGLLLRSPPSVAG